jgi:hypothetical protein
MLTSFTKESGTWEQKLVALSCLTAVYLLGIECDGNLFLLTLKNALQWHPANVLMQALYYAVSVLRLL